MANNAERIAEIREILSLGVTSVTRDGSMVSYDLDQLRTELRELESTDDTLRGRRPEISSINMRHW
jgi:hypothetical protein